MPSQLHHELAKLRGKISKTDEIYTDSIASLYDAIIKVEISIKALEADNKNLDGSIRKSSNIAKLGLAMAKTSFKKAGGSLSGYLDMDGHSINGTDSFYAYSILGNTFYNYLGVPTLTISHAGNIVPAGHVDGRDVAVDGAKLDGISNGADSTSTAGILAAGSMNVLQGWVEYTDDGTPVAIGTLPANSYIIDVFMQVTELFNDSGNDFGMLGDSGDTDCIIASRTDINTTGIKPVVPGLKEGYNAAAIDVIATYLGAFHDASTGKMLIGVVYFTTDAQP